MSGGQRTVNHVPEKDGEEATAGADVAHAGTRHEHVRQQLSHDCVDLWRADGCTGNAQGLRAVRVCVMLRGHEKLAVRRTKGFHNAQRLDETGLCANGVKLRPSRGMLAWPWTTRANALSKFLQRPAWLSASTA